MLSLNRVKVSYALFGVIQPIQLNIYEWLNYKYNYKYGMYVLYEK